MNDKMKIVIEIPNTGLEETILRGGKWEDDSLFGRTLRNALMNFTKEEPILDKIRAEIIELRSRQNVGVLECLDIIDKYKTESE